MINRTPSITLGSQLGSSSMFEEPYMRVQTFDLLLHLSLYKVDQLLVDYDLPVTLDRIHLDVLLAVEYLVLRCRGCACLDLRILSLLQE